MITRQAVVQQARKYLGVPWRHQGRDRNGVDCVGLIVRVCQDLGISDYDESGYAKLAKGRSLINAIARRCQAVRTPLPGDLILFRYDSNPQHVAIATDHPSGELGIVHANATVKAGLALRGRVTECIYAAPWADRSVAFFHLPKVEY